MISQTNYKQLLSNLEYLKLKQMALHLDEVIDFSIANQTTFIDTLVKLTSYEVDLREKNMVHAMVKVGAFPNLKEVKDFEFEFQPSIKQQQIQDLLTLRFIDIKIY